METEISSKERSLDLCTDVTLKTLPGTSPWNDPTGRPSLDTLPWNDPTGIWLKPISTMQEKKYLLGKSSLKQCQSFGYFTFWSNPNWTKTLQSPHPALKSSFKSLFKLGKLLILQLLWKKRKNCWLIKSRLKFSNLLSMVNIVLGTKKILEG